MEKLLRLILLLWTLTVATETDNKVPDETDGAKTGHQNNIYRGDKVLRISTPSDEDFRNLLSLLRATLPVPEVDVWREPSPRVRSADIYVTYQHLAAVNQTLRQHGFSYHTFIDDVQRLVDDELEENELPTTRWRRSLTHAVPPPTSVLDKYARHHEILAWHSQLMVTYPHLVTLYNIGLTTQGRTMQVIRIGRDIGRWKPAIFVDAAMHAREWIAPSTAVFLINHLLTQYWTNSTVREYVDRIDWYFLPVANPDGYEYTHTTARLWRKNRRLLPESSAYPYPCVGVDLNRNWGFNWGGENASPYPCDIMYRGPTAMSEPEVQNIANFLLDRTDCVRFYVSLHSYTQFWFTRWSFADVLPPDHLELISLAQEAVEAINRTHGYDYDAGTSPKLLYVFSGGSSDWAKGVAGIKYSYLIELRDRGRYGFLLPKKEIIPTGEEIWAGMEVVAQRALLRYPVTFPLEEEETNEEGDENPDLLGEGEDPAGDPGTAGNPNPLYPHHPAQPAATSFPSFTLRPSPIVSASTSSPLDSRGESDDDDTDLNNDVNNKDNSDDVTNNENDIVASLHSGSVSQGLNGKLAGVLAVCSLLVTL